MNYHSRENEFSTKKKGKTSNDYLSTGVSLLISFSCLPEFSFSLLVFKATSHFQCDMTLMIVIHMGAKVSSERWNSSKTIAELQNKRNREKSHPPTHFYMNDFNDFPQFCHHDRNIWIKARNSKCLTWIPASVKLNKKEFIKRIYKLKLSRFEM